MPFEGVPDGQNGELQKCRQSSRSEFCRGKQRKFLNEEFQKAAGSGRSNPRESGEFLYAPLRAPSPSTSHLFLRGPAVPVYKYIIIESGQMARPDRDPGPGHVSVLVLPSMLNGQIIFLQIPLIKIL